MVDSTAGTFLAIPSADFILSIGLSICQTSKLNSLPIFSVIIAIVCCPICKSKAYILHGAKSMISWSLVMHIKFILQLKVLLLMK